MQKVIKVEACKECKAGHHAFIATKYQMTASFQKLVEMTCSKCLLSLDLLELANVKKMHNESKSKSSETERNTD